MVLLCFAPPCHQYCFSFIADVTAESRKTLKFVIPAKAGIQSFQGVEQNHITRFRRKRDFLQ
ncbi:MAG: hypothetical protein EA399_09915 [Desulfovibrionales bacterium]|nr:MAG: hypothetical protein EA399_09915 [Desulfovibrionales bacterium]